MFCCNAFKNLIENAGERGLAVLVSEHLEGLKFALQMRAVAFTDEAGFSQGPLPVTPTNISLSGSMRIRFCPSCGKRLEELVSEDIKLFEELAVKHKPFQNDWGL
jgi:hypothetical protein